MIPPSDPSAPLPSVSTEEHRAVAESRVDRRGWPPGPWDGEPDRVEWRHAGFPCLALRSPLLGVWCGYVGLPPDHRHHGAPHDAVDVSVHGGLCYGAPCSGDICHVAQPGEPDEVWWLGFDCGHAHDLSPRNARVFAHLVSPHFAYRDLAYITAEINGLAEQLADLGRTSP
jgi:hypothetical protein